MLVRFLLVCDLLFILFRIALGPSAGKKLFLWLFSCVVLILVQSQLYVSLSHLVFWAGCGIRLCRFLIIAFCYLLFIFSVVISGDSDFYFMEKMFISLEGTLT